MSNWLDSSNNANCFKQTYVQGFVDVSGGSIITRGTGGGLVIGGDSSLNGTVYLGNSIYVRSDGMFPGTADNGATSYDISGNAENGATSYDISGNAENGATSYDISGNADNGATSYDISGNAENGATLLSKYFSTDASWSQLGFDIDGEKAGDQSGSVSLINSATYGLVVAIGAYLNDGTNTTTSDNSGHVRVYQYKTITDTNWNNYNIADTSYNGITPYDKPIVIGASGDTSPVPDKKYWVQLGADIEGEKASDESGISVSLVDASGGLVVAIGANANDSTATNVSDNRGHVRVYQYKTITDTNWNNYNKTNTIYSGNPIVFGALGDTNPVPNKKYWVQLGADIDGEYADDRWGTSVSLINSATYGLVVASGAINHDNPAIGGDNRYGNVRVWRYGGSSWIKLGPDIDGENAGDQSGISVSLVDSASGLVVAIGARANDGTFGVTDNRGHVRVWQYNGSSWIKLGADIDGELAGDNSGHSVSLINSATYGLAVAIGAFNNDGTAYSTNTSDNRGHVRVYQYDATKTTAETNQSSSNFGPVGWKRLGADIDGEYADDLWGTSVSLVDASGGLVVAIGANQNDGNGSNSGHVRVYEIPYTNTYSDVSGGYYDISGGYYDISGGYLNDGLTSAALYINGDTDLSGGLSVSGDISFNAGNLFVAGDLSLNGNLYINSYAANSINADAIDSTVDINFANKLSVSTADISFNATTLQVATDFNSDNTLTTLSTNLKVPANIAIVDGSNGTVYGSYLTLTNKGATAYYNVGKSASGIFNIVNQANAGVYLASGGTSFTGTSDARLKTNIAPLESATDKIMALNPCTYQWKSEVESNADGTDPNTKPHVGFIAQEVEQVMPELVHPIDHPAGPDYKGVNTTDLIPYLVRTIQENTRKLAKLRAGIDEYKNR